MAIQRMLGARQRKGFYKVLETVLYKVLGNCLAMQWVFERGRFLEGFLGRVLWRSCLKLKVLRLRGQKHTLSQCMNPLAYELE